MTVADNWLDQELDIQGSGTVDNARVLTDESGLLGLASATGTGDTIGGAAPSMTLTDAGGAFTAADIGKFITVVGATTGANNGTFLISDVTGGTVLEYQNASGVAEAFPGTYSIRRPYSLLDDEDFHRTDRKNIKGTASHVTDVPTYQRPDAVGTNVPANLTNIASKTTDAKALVNSRKFENATATEADTVLTLTDTGNLPHADAVDRTGVPINDGADSGNDEATYAEIIDPATSQALEVDGRAVGSITNPAGASIVDGETFVIDDGVNPPVTFEFDDDATVVESAVLRAVAFTGGETVAALRTIILDAINNAPALDVLATTGGAGVTDVTVNTPGTAGNNTITETVVNAGFIVVGLAGGTANGGQRIYGRMQAGGATEPNSVEVGLRSVAHGALLSTSVAYIWEKFQPTTLDIYFPFRERLDNMSETALRTTLVHGVQGDAEISGDIADILAALGLSSNETFFTFTNLTDFYVFSTLDSSPTATDAFNALNDEIGTRDYTGAILVDGETITESLQKLASAIAASSIVRTIERLVSAISAGTPHTLPGALTYTLDGTGNGRNMYVFWRGLLRDPGTVVAGDDYDETSTTSITPHKLVKSGDHVNYMILT